MPKTKKITKQQKEEATKESITGFKGGFRVNLSRVMDSGEKLRDVLSKHVGETLDLELKNQEVLIDKLSTWHDQYKGKREPKAFPWENCFSRDTEVLSAKGWVKVEDVETGLHVLSMNPKTGESTYQIVKSVTRRYEKSLLHIWNKSVDFMVTPDHKMAVWSEGEKNKFKFVQAKDLNTGHKIPLTSDWKIYAPNKIFGLDTINLMRFVGWYISEGWTYKSGTIGISQSLKNSVNRAKIRDVLDSLGFKYSENKRSFLVSAKNIPWALRSLLKSLGKSYEKFIPRIFLNLNKSQLSALLESLIDGDGSITFQEDRNYPKIAYGTSSRQLADDVQELVQKIGLRGRIRQEDHRGEILTGIKRLRPGVVRHKFYVINICFKDKAKVFRTEIAEEEYGDNAYCFTVPPYHSVYVRRNGIAAWCGQSANVAIPISRSNTDAIFVRIIDAIFNKVKIWIVKAQKKEFVDFDRELEEQLNWFQKNVLKLKKKLFSPLLECIKTGTGIIMIVNEERHDTRYAYATNKELRDKNVKKYSAKGTPDKLVKHVDKSYIGPNIYPIPRSDFVISSDATSIQDAYLVGFRTRYRKPQIDLKVRQELYDKEEVKKLTQPDAVDEATERRAESQGKEISKTDYEKPYEIWQLHLHYDVDEDGEEDDIVISFHRNTGAILRCIYNPLFKGFRPFKEFVFYPTEYSFDGEGICEILETLQKVADTITNQRLDRMTLINNPWIFVRAGEGLDDLKPSPGKVIVVHGELDSAIKIVNHPDIYPSTFAEEDRINSYADRAVGITPAVMGISTAERPVAKETLALQQEANKKFKAGIDNLRDDLTELAWMLIDFFTQYQPTYKYGEMGEEQTIRFPTEYMRDGINIELATSSEMLNQEIRREITLTIYQILSDYMTKVAGMAQLITNPEVPSGLKNVVIDASAISVKVLNRLLEDFEIRDADDLVLSIEKSMDTEKAVAQSVDLMPQQPPQPGQPGPTGAPQAPAPPPGQEGLV